jgi:hypothetical protein
MSSLQVDVPDELADQLRPLADQLPQILALGLRELNAASQPGFAGAAEVLEFLARLPTPEETLTLQPSEALRRRVAELLDRSKESDLSPTEEQEWQQYAFLEHLVRVAKAQALLKLKQA